MKIELSGHYSCKRLLVSSLPSMAMMIIGSLYSIVDGLFVSNYVGLSPFAGLNIAWPGIMVVGALGLMVGTGGSALISILLGQKNLKKACETFTTLVAFTILMAVALGIPMYILMPKIVVVLGAEGEELIRNAALYGRFYAVGMPAFMLQMAFQPFFMADTETLFLVHNQQTQIFKFDAFLQQLVSADDQINTTAAEILDAYIRNI